jgi:solute carrier family 25 iron transporter 28/37
MAGAVAAAVTTPLDVCKTLLQTRGNSDDAAIRKARGMLDAAKIIYARQGPVGFTRGMTPRIVSNIPSNALCWYVHPLPLPATFPDRYIILVGYLTRALDSF